MLEENAIIEWMIHLMEIGMVIGIAAVVAYTLHRNRHEFGTGDHAQTGVAANDPTH